MMNGRSSKPCIMFGCSTFECSNVDLAELSTVCTDDSMFSSFSFDLPNENAAVSSTLSV